MEDSQPGKPISLARAFCDILGSMPWLEYLAWVAAITVLPLLSLVFAGYRIRYQRLVLRGDGRLPRFDWNRPLGDVGTAFAVSIMTVLLLYAVAIPVYWGILRPLHLPYDRTIFFAVFGVLFAAVEQSIVIIVILPSMPHHSRLRHFFGSIRRHGVSFTLASATALVVEGITYFGYALPMPFWTWRAGIEFPAFGEPLGLATYYASMAAILSVTLVGQLIVSHLFAQFGRGPLDELIAAGESTGSAKAM